MLMKRVSILIGLLFVDLCLDLCIGHPVFASDYEAFMKAIEGSNSAEVERILGTPDSEKKLSFDLNQKREDSWSPLALAAAHGNVDLVRRLIARGADVGAKV